MTDTKGGQTFRRKLQKDNLFAVAKDFDLAGIVNRLDTSLHFFDIVAGFAWAEAIGNEGIDIAEHVAKVVVELKARKFPGEVAANIAHHVADRLPDERQVLGFGRRQKLHKNNRLPWPRDGA